DCTGDCLANPPCCIGREFEALGVVKLLNCFDQTQVSFLNQIQELHAAANIAFCDADNQSQVCLGQTFSCIRVALCHSFSQFNLFLWSQQRNTADLLEVNFDRVIDADTVYRQQCIVILVP